MKSVVELDINVPFWGSLQIQRSSQQAIWPDRAASHSGRTPSAHGGVHAFCRTTRL